MKKLFLLLLFVPFLSVAQTPELLEMLKTIEGSYKIDGNKDVFMQEVMELDSNLTKDQLYFIAKEYIASSYGDAKSVIQVDDKERGLIICKGLYSDIKCTEVYIGSAGEYTATHILKIDIKDGRIRVTITVTNINEYYAPTYVNGFYDKGRSTDRKMTDYYPINQGPRDIMEKKLKTREGYVFYRVVWRMKNTFASIKLKFTKPQNYNFTDGNDDW